jgi:hypothetical protein
MSLTVNQKKLSLKKSSRYLTATKSVVGFFDFSAIDALKG